MTEDSLFGLEADFHLQLPLSICNYGFPTPCIYRLWNKKARNLTSQQEMLNDLDSAKVTIEVIQFSGKKYLIIVIPRKQ